MKGECDDFTNCGVHQRRRPDGAVTLDKDEYIDALIPSGTSTWSRRRPTIQPDVNNPTFIFLLGAAAYVLLTQHRVAARVVAPQRAKSKLLA
eukprot:3276480-Pyramimonas_sp.AAC.1